MRRSFTSSSPPALAALSAFLTTVRQTPAKAAIASIWNLHAVDVDELASVNEMDLLPRDLDHLQFLNARLAVISEGRAIEKLDPAHDGSA
jgi:hypothetical protein